MRSKKFRERSLTSDPGKDLKMADNQNNGVQQDIADVLAIRRQKLDELRAEGHDPFVITKYDRTHHSSDIKDNFEALEGKEVSVAGRLMSKRIMGKASFAMCRILWERCRHMSRVIALVRMNTATSKSSISAISWA